MLFGENVRLPMWLRYPVLTSILRNFLSFSIKISPLQLGVNGLYTSYPLPNKSTTTFNSDIVPTVPVGRPKVLSRPARLAAPLLLHSMEQYFCARFLYGLKSFLHSLQRFMFVTPSSYAQNSTNQGVCQGYFRLREV